MLNYDWKERAIDRRLENKALKRRLKELKESRDNWKEKSIAYKSEIDNLLAKLNALKKKINQINEITIVR